MFKKYTFLSTGIGRTVIKLNSIVDGAKHSEDRRLRQFTVSQLRHGITSIMQEQINIQLNYVSLIKIVH